MDFDTVDPAEVAFKAFRGSKQNYDIGISATSNIRTFLHNNVTFLSFMAHWLSLELKLEHGVFVIKPFPSSYIGENIARNLNNTISDRLGY